VDPTRNARAGTRLPVRDTGPPGAARRHEPGAPAAAPPTPAEAIDRLAKDVQQLKVDFERFWSGALPFPPEDLRTRIQQQLRNLRNGVGLTAVDSFRLSDLEARFNSYGELHGRRLRAREDGHRRVAAPPPAAATPAASAARHDVERGILVGEAVEPAAVAALYSALAARPGESLRFDLASFETYLLRQAAAIRGKTGCAQVQFRLAPEDGKLKLKARPLGAPGAQREES
jgi:hypothetical protein